MSGCSKWKGYFLQIPWPYPPLIVYLFTEQLGNMLLLPPSYISKSSCGSIWALCATLVVIRITYKMICQYALFLPNIIFCLSASRIERECPSRHYVFERHTRKKLKLAVSDIKEVIAANRTDCEDRYCLFSKSTRKIQYLLLTFLLNFFYLPFFLLGA